ncbi:Catabolic L-serine/threonine dehydratase [Sparassis crispa]|uniref:L-serine ammonia-lyase n=1 Tax=Sparassis crispa TaxID=139825 RepID=A0A401GJX4_9APHY|nr:Catabolic L-serine/threonine dehydratase [Sparassis crispa]GBE82460.1 Catabolic L-serine/threonine dehydratase [Sparassis crispa]
MSTLDGKLWSETPLIFSSHISARLGCNAYLKLENLQPSQSFKYRGISLFVQHALRTHGPDTHLIIASGGNAGLAAACAAKALCLRCTIFLPEGVSRSTIDFMRREGANIVTAGRCYAQALAKAEEVMVADPKAVLVPAYDNSILWEGHASMITEIVQQLPPGMTPAAIFCSVGGGGLLGGVLQGCRSVGWDHVPVVALETLGSNSFYQSLALNPGAFTATESHLPPEGVRAEHDSVHNVNVAHLSTLKSRATSLGASSASAAVVKMALDRKGGLKSVCLPDEFLMKTARSFAEEHKMLVELACAATLTSAYNPALFEKILPSSPSSSPRTVVFIVCGGFKVDLEELEEYRTGVQADANNGSKWQVLCNGEQWALDM